ncbi:MAG: L-2-amino-thiazoline-4-carboxylic acid hydrolase [Coriobacteriales bacterium]|nr:L-2-amino-thiazoline-4-carboxylic acid hydrolase [Coriobacteriales bacterium]
MSVDKSVRKHARSYRKALAHAHISNPDACVAAFQQRLSDMYASEQFRAHNAYPTIDVERVYAVIAMCLELAEYGLSDQEIYNAVNAGYTMRRRLFGLLLAFIDHLPNAFAIARKWNIQDHAKRVADGSIDYDLFEVREHSLEYSISGCRYVDMFAAWGVRPLCKIFCETDTRSYAELTRHVEFVRHSDLATGESCHDEIFERGWRR